MKMKRYLDSNTDRYDLRKQTEDSKIQEANDKIQRLEKEELRLVAALKLTTANQRNAFNNLDKVVDDGYKYYLQSFAEKRSIQEYNNQANNYSSTMSIPTSLSIQSEKKREKSHEPPEKKSEEKLLSAATMLQEDLNR